MLKQNESKELSEFYSYKEYPKYCGPHDVYNLDEIRQLFYWAKAKSYHKQDCEFVDVLSRYSEPIKENGTTYFLKEDIDKYVDMENGVIDLKQLFDKTNFTEMSHFTNFLKKRKVEYHTARVIPFIKYVTVDKGKYDEIIDIINKYNKRKDMPLHKGYPVFRGSEEVYNLNEVRELFYWNKAKSYYDYDYELVDVLTKYSQPIQENDTTYFLKKDIDKFVDMKNNVIDLKEVLEKTTFQKLDSLVRFLKRHNIEYNAPGLIPLYKSLTIDKAKYDVVVDTLNNYLRIRDTCTSIHKGFPVYQGSEDVYNINEVRDKCYWIDNITTLKRDDRVCEILNNYCKPIKKNGTSYYLKEDIDAFVKMRENVVPIKELFSLSQYCDVKSYVRALRNKNVKVYKGNEIPFYKELHVRKEGYPGISASSEIVKGKSDYMKALEIAQGSNTDDIKELYYSRQEAAKILGINNDSSRKSAKIASCCRYVKKSREMFFLKEDVHYFKDLKEKTVRLKDVYKDTGLSMSGITAIIKKGEFEYFNPQDIPFDNCLRVYQEDVDYIRDIQAQKKEYLSAGKHRKYELLKEMSRVKKNEKITETLKDLDEYIQDKLNNSKDSTACGYYIAGGQLYNFFNMSLTKDFKRYYVPEDNEDTPDSIHKLISLFLMDDNNSAFSFYILIKFYNFLVDKYKLTGKYKKVEINRDELYDIGTMNVDPYTREQFIELFDGLYNNLYDSESFFQKVTTDYELASTWLYMALHFCVGWRMSDIANIEHPDLSIIGFSTGQEFLDYLTDHSKFTEEMGFAICSNVKSLVEGLGRKAQKNGEDLVIEIGRSLVKPLGMMFAVCEAYRMINNKKYLMNVSIIKKKSRQKAVLGARYKEIFGDDTFSNRRANKTYLNYLVAKSDGENNGIGYILAALARSHKLNENLIPINTQKYVNREVDRDISTAAMELWNSGGFGFVKHELLSLLDDDFTSKRLAEKREEIKKISISPLGLNDVSKTISEQASVSKNVTHSIISNLSKDKVLFRETILNLTKSSSTGKHYQIKCLLRAMPFEAILGLSNIDDFKSMTNINTTKDICLYPDVSHCEGCPMLIAQIYYIFELKNKINEVLTKIDEASDEFDIMLLSKIFVEGYTPILNGIVDEVGVDSIKAMINLSNIQSKVIDLQRRNKLRLS